MIVSFCASEVYVAKKNIWQIDHKFARNPRSSGKALTMPVNERIFFWSILLEVPLRTGYSSDSLVISDTTLKSATLDVSQGILLKCPELSACPKYSSSGGVYLLFSPTSTTSRKIATNYQVHCGKNLVGALRTWVTFAVANHSAAQTGCCGGILNCKIWKCRTFWAVFCISANLNW